MIQDETADFTEFAYLSIGGGGERMLKKCKARISGPAVFLP
jgi:hypothetical protein